MPAEGVALVGAAGDVPELTFHSGAIAWTVSPPSVTRTRNVPAPLPVA